MSERNDRIDEQQPPAARPEDEEVMIEDLEDVAGGMDINFNCPCNN